MERATSSPKRDPHVDGHPHLARKKQRLNEGERGLSPDTSILIEADEPEDIGTNFANAIHIDDDLVLTPPEPYSDAFANRAFPGSSMDQLADLHDDLLRHNSVKMRSFASLADNIDQHIKNTADDPSEWRLRYLDDEAEFFAKLATTSLALLNGDDFFDEKEYPGVQLLRGAFQNFTVGLQALCHRIVPLLPDAIKRALSRRDSAQVGSKVQELGALYYIIVMHRLHFTHTALTFYFRRFENVAFIDQITRHNRAAFYEDDMILSLAAVICSLSGSMRELKDAWPVLSVTLELFRTAIEVESMHRRYPTEQLEAVLGAMNHFLLPAICGKHPRALPEKFHGTLVKLGSSLLQFCVEHSERDRPVQLYEQFVKCDSDAIIPPTMHTQDLEASLWQIAGEHKPYLAHLLSFSWALQAYISFIRSDIMDVRNAGISLLKEHLMELYVKHLRDVGPDGVRHPVVQYTVRFLKENKITDYLFGPESRAGLIGHSGDIVLFLAVTNSYTDVETDIIWRACSTSVEADFVKASFSILEQVMRWFDFKQLIYMTRKYATSPVDRLGSDAVDFYDKLIHQLQDANAMSGDDTSDHIMASTFVEVVKAVSIGTPCPVRDELCRLTMCALMRFAQPGVQLDQRAEIYNQCIPDIKSGSAYSTASVEILSLFLNIRLQPEEVDLILKLLPVTAAVDELCRFVRRYQEDIQATAATPAVVARLDCIVHLMNLAPITLEKETADKLFDHAFGESALGNPARDLAWNKLNDLTQRKAPLEAASSLWQTYTQERVPHLDPRIATSALIGFISASLKATFTPDQIIANPTAPLAHPLWKALVRIASAAEDGRVVEAATCTILELLFRYPSTWKDPPAAIVECQCEFVREHIESMCSECKGLIDTDEAAAVRKFTRGIAILQDTLDQSKHTAHFFVATPSRDILVVGASDDDGEALLFAAHVYGANNQPKIVQIRATADTLISELVEKLSEVTAATDNRIIVGGKEISLQPTRTLRDANVQQSGVIMICPKYTSDLDLDRVMTSPGPVEQVVVSRYDALDAFLDGPESIAQPAFEFLCHVRTSAHARAQVLSQTATAMDLFPKDRPWRSRMSLVVLQHHLFDFAQLGVSDQAFISNSIRLLVAVVLDTSRPFDPPVILEVARGLCVFFQNIARRHVDSPLMGTETAGKSAHGEVIAHLDDRKVFISRMVSLIFDGLSLPLGTILGPDGLTLRANVARTLYRGLVESCRAHTSLWQEVAQHADVVELHKHLLLDDDLALSREVSICIRDLCLDSSVLRDISAAYWRVVNPSLPDAMRRGGLSENYFLLLSDIVNNVHFTEAELRSMVQTFANELWSYQHVESTRLAFTDQAVAGLLRVLGLVITFLRGYKKPLNLGGLASKLFRHFLFPPIGHPHDHPLTNEVTRHLVYDIARWCFEPTFDYDELLNTTNTALMSAVREPGFRYPGQSDWCRAPNVAVGLYNLGMTCYMNSLLQQLYANLPFRKFIFDQPVPPSQRGSILFHVQVLFAHMQNNVCPVITPDQLAEALKIQTGNQEDVHTFYTTLLSRLEECVEGSDNKTALANFFTGKSITQIKGDCGHVSSRTESFTELSITVKNKTCLAESLDEFVQGEPLEGANKYKCMTCEFESGGRLINAVKRTCLEEVPDNLTFCLKRFTYETMLEGENKVNDKFDFPSTIDMSLYKRSYLEAPGAQREPDIFELTGVIVHQGSLQFGHYWSYVRASDYRLPQGDAWIYLEDSKALHCVNGVQDVQRSCFGGPKWPNGADRADSAYVLCYRRQSHIAQARAMNTVPRDLQFQYQVLPEVQMPQDLAIGIDLENTWRQLRSSFFAHDFGDHVIWLLAQWPDVLRKRVAPSSASEDSNDMDVVEMPPNDRTDIMLATLVAQYVSKVLPADPVAETRLDAFMTALNTVVETSPAVARHTLTLLADKDGFPFSNIVRQDSPKVRKGFFMAIEKCMAVVREHAPEMYGEVFMPLIQSHAVVVNFDPMLNGYPLDCSRGRWSEYLAFASDFAQLGVEETGVILNGNYLQWVFDILLMRQDLEMRKRHVDLFNWWKLNTSDLSSLFDFLHAVLRDHVDLLQDPDTLSSPIEDRIRTPNGWCLQKHECLQILRCKDVPSHGNRYKLWLMVLAARLHCETSHPHWQRFAPGKLLGLLTSDKVHPVISQTMESLMPAYFDYEEEYQTPVLYMALHFLANRADEECRIFMRQLSKNLVLWHQSMRDTIWFYNQAYHLAPLSTIQSIPQWAPQFLTERKVLPRARTAAFLREHLFAPEALSTNPTLDATRIHVTRQLVEPLQTAVQQAYNHEQARGAYEHRLEVLHYAAEYLARLRDAVSQAEQDEEGVVLAPQVRVETDESRVVLAGLTRTLHDLQDWEPETTSSSSTLLPTRLHGGADSVRKSVETEEESLDPEPDRDGDLESSDDAEMDDMSSDVEEMP